MIEKPVKKTRVSPWTLWFWGLLLLHAIGIGAWYGSQHPLSFLRSSPGRTRQEARLVWTTPADFVGSGWPSPQSAPSLAPASKAPPSAPPQVKGAFITVHRLTTLPAETSGAPVGVDWQRAFADYDNLIKRCIEDRWNPPKGATDSPAKFKLRVSVGGIIQNAGITAKSVVVELNRSVADLLEKLDRTGKPLPEGWATEYEVEVELRAAP